MQNRIKPELDRLRSTWCDLPDYIYTEKYEQALTEWIMKHVVNGRTDIETLILYALHHETGDKLPYFPFDRSINYG